MSTLEQKSQRWLDKIEIGDSISISSINALNLYGWNGATVLQINETQIKVQLRHQPLDDIDINDSKPRIISIDKNPQQIDAVPCVQYIDLESLARGTIPPFPAYYHNQETDDKYIIISLGGSKSSAAIYSYNITTKQYKQIATYPFASNAPNRHGIAVDSNKHELYLFSGQTQCFATYNLLDNTFTADCIAESFKMPKMPQIYFPQSINVSSPVDQIYFKGVDKDKNKFTILKYLKTSKQLINLTDNFPNKQLRYTSMIYDEDRERIMLFGGSGDHTIEPRPTFDDIWIYNTNTDKNIDKMWEKHDVTLPYAKNRDVVFGFDSIAFIIYTDLSWNEIWCLELITMKWFKSHLNFPKELRSCDVVKVDNNYIHCLDYENVHVRINLYDMVPIELLQFYSKYYFNLIVGFIRITFEDKYCCHVSEDLKIVISKYYNALL